MKRAARRPESGFLDRGDRGGYYMALYNMTGNAQCIEQAQISTVSEGAGGVAYAANYLLQTNLAQGEYPGIYFLSQEVAKFSLQALQQKLLINPANTNNLSGGAGDDELRADAGHDQLFGGDGHDDLFGGDGRDTLDGGKGWNRLEGGSGDDLYIARVTDLLSPALADAQFFDVSTTIGDSQGHNTIRVDALQRDITLLPMAGPAGIASRSVRASRPKT